MSKEMSIGFPKEAVPLIISGEKRYTYRRNTKNFEHIQVGDKVLARNRNTNETFGHLEITERQDTTFKDLPINKEGHESYLSKEEQRRIFEKYYGEIEDNDNMIILGFYYIDI